MKLGFTNEEVTVEFNVEAPEICIIVYLYRVKCRAQNEASVGKPEPLPQALFFPADSGLMKPTFRDCSRKFSIPLGFLFRSRHRHFNSNSLGNLILFCRKNLDEKLEDRE